MPEPAEPPRADTGGTSHAPARNSGAWYLNTRKLVLVIGVTVGVLLLLAALASAIDLPNEDTAAEQDPSDQTASNNSASNNSASNQGGTDQGSGGLGGSANGRIELGDGQGVDVQPIPGCPGGLALGDDILIVPDPEACGFEPIPPGATGFESSGRAILVPDVEGDIGGFRPGPDGIELLAPGDLRAGDFAIGQRPDGSFELVRPDGSAVEIVPGDDGLTLRDPERGSTDFVPRPGAGFGTQMPPQSPDPSDTDPSDTDTSDTDPSDTDPSDTGSTAFPLRLVLVVVGGLVGLAAAFWFWNRPSGRPSRPEAVGATPETSAVELSAIDRLLWEIDHESDPRTSIRKVYAALETGLGNPSMARRHHETPGVFLDRLLGRIDGLSDPLHELVVLFEHARFSEHEMTTEMRERARRSLGEIRGRYASAESDQDGLASVT